MQPALDVFSLLALGDVADDSLQATVVQLPTGNLRGEDRPVLAPQAQLFADDVPAGAMPEHLLYPRNLLRAQQVLRAERCQFVERVAQHVARRTVRVHGASLSIRDDDAVDDLLRETTIAVLTRAQRFALTQRAFGLVPWRVITKTDDDANRRPVLFQGRCAEHDRKEAAIFPDERVLVFAKLDACLQNV